MSHESPRPAHKARFGQLETRGDSHDHFGILYDSESEQLAIALSFVKQGIDRGDRIIYAVGDNTADDIQQAMRDAGFPVEQLRDSGQLSIETTRDLYCSGNEFDREEMMATLQSRISDTVSDADYRGLRIAAEFTGGLFESIDVEEFMEYDHRVNELFGDHEVFGLCQFDRSSIPEGVATEVIRTHPMLAHQDTVGENAYYHPLNGQQPSPEQDVTTKLEAHRSRVETKQELDRRESELGTLIEGIRDLLQAGWPEAGELALRTVRQLADYEAVALWSYDSDADEIELQNALCAESLSDQADLSQYSEIAWRAFVANEAQQASIEDGSKLKTTPLEQVVAFPIQGEGALLVATSDTERIDEPAMRVGRTFSRTLQSAIKRSDQQRRLERRDSDLSRLETVNGLVREIIRTTTEATSREDIEQAFCDTVTGVDEFALAWIGNIDPDAESVTPRSWAGAEQGYLSETTDGTPADGPVFQTGAAGETRVVPAIADHRHEDGWRERALDRGFRSLASIPLEHDGISYGVATIYATESGVFDELLEGVLTELGHFIGYMLDVVDQETALRNGRPRELEVELESPDFPLLELAKQTDCKLEFDELLVKDDSTVLAIGKAFDATSSELSQAAETAITIEQANVVGFEDETVLVDLSLSEPFLGAALASRGGQLQAVRADSESATLIVSIPESVKSRAIVDEIAEQYQDPSLVAKREESESSRHVLTADLREQLTDRQREVALVAFRAGYFESPRQCSGEEVADILDISPQAFYQHMRRIQQTVFAALIGDS